MGEKTPLSSEVESPTEDETGVDTEEDEQRDRLRPLPPIAEAGERSERGEKSDRGSLRMRRRRKSSDPSEKNKASTDDYAAKASLDTDAQTKWERFRVRTFWTLLMIGGFFLIIGAGHVYCWALVIFLKLMIFYEILRLKRRKEKEKAIPYFPLLNWYFFVVTIVFVHGKLLQDRLMKLEGNPLRFLYKYHTFTCFCLYLLGFLMFVLSLKKGRYKYQFSQFGWTHIVLVLVVVQSSLFIPNIYEGLIWFLLPCSLVIVNDIFAYIFGFFFGKKLVSVPLIKLSPKKTWEGFIGAFFSTIVWAFFFSLFLSNFEAMRCPQTSIVFAPFQPVNCSALEESKVLSSLYSIQYFQLPAIVSKLSGGMITQVPFYPIQVHGMILAAFASLIGPFGGFFASGFKRAFKVKDFGDSIPGHGGITDRMDCQIMMATFTYIYYINFVDVRAPGVAKLFDLAMRLGVGEQEELLRLLQAHVHI
uniref:Phosphatidate cytidylyltransferase n=1 Tax=Palpitomonas bilix TaxID=652834 RepID=A0A7S3D8I4_9EUKA|mmetsp:Transcript_26015/g.66046  ORF Transcript_26015/g.66046 Transcript_26015/m.66046 type:complete len:474 (+) Transcript_26015:1856-3277(+)